MEADGFDAVASDCESALRASMPAAAGTAPTTRAAKVAASGATLQRLGGGPLRVLATSSEPGIAAASGFIDVAGLALPLKSNAGVSPGAARRYLAVKLSRRQMRRADGRSSASAG